MTTRNEPAPAQLSPDVAQVARGSVTNLVAMALGAVLGFGLTVLVSRWLQPTDAGGFFELIALFTIVSSTLYLGADTGLTRWISRARAIGGLDDARRVVMIALIPVLIAALVAAAAVWIAAPAIARTFLSSMGQVTAVTDVRIVAPLVPLGALSACILAATRGFGRMWPYLAVEGLGKPAMRVGLVLVALVAGWGIRGALVAWSAPVAIGAVAAWFILGRLMRAEPPDRHLSPVSSSGPVGTSSASGTREPGPVAPGRAAERGRHRRPRPGAAPPRPRLAGEFWRFAAPRGFAGTFQIVVVWLDILLVGAILSRYDAGVYAAVSKLALVGAYTLEATRLSIGPQLSQALARKEHDRAAELHQSATGWLVLASWPVYILIAIFPAVVLGIFGHRYTPGAAALAILALAMLVNLGTGNVTVVLLMGGKSSLSAYNALAALVVNIGLNLLLLPRLGLVGAALAWAAAIVVENLAAVVEVWWTLGIKPVGSGYWLVATASAACFGLAGLGARIVLHQTLPALAAATAMGLVAYCAVLYATRGRLQLAGLFAALLRPIRPGLQPGQPSRKAA
jgi:O-antigen/teichoic acid export membrane protein